MAGGEQERWSGAGAESEARAAVVLRCVFAHLAPRDLWRCGAVCRAWRRAAADPALWRRALRPRVPPTALRVLADATTDGSSWSWRYEYQLSASRWRRRARLWARGAGAAALRCVALHALGDCVALVDEHALLTIFELTSHSEDGGSAAPQWIVRSSSTVSAAWRDVSHAQWAPPSAGVARRALLLAAPLALADRHEILVVSFNEQWRARVSCRCVGAVACWVSDAAFLTLQLHLLAPGRACTTVWLNAASQETQSEHAGVAAPLLRLYNEAAAHTSHILVAHVPRRTEDTRDDAPDDAMNDASDDAVDDATSDEPSAAYYHALTSARARSCDRYLVAAGGARGARGRRGVATALQLWPLPAALALPPLRVADELAQRVRSRRARRDARDEPPPDPPDEPAVRALCTPPAATCSLDEQIFAIVLHPTARCVWAATARGAWCASLPALRPLLRLPTPEPGPERALPPHYVGASVDRDYFATAAGCGAARVLLWSLRGALPTRALHTDAPAHAALLLPRARTSRGHALLVLTSDALQEWCTLDDIQ